MTARTNCNGIVMLILLAICINNKTLPVLKHDNHNNSINTDISSFPNNDTNNMNNNDNKFVMKTIRKK